MAIDNFNDIINEVKRLKKVLKDYGTMKELLREVKVYFDSLSDDQIRAIVLAAPELYFKIIQALR